jgi:hypothetical protein
MKIEGPRGVSQTGGARKTGAAAPGFAPSAPENAPRATAAGSVAATSALDAVLALQAEGFDPGRRSRQVRRAQDALDALSRLERGLLEGAAPGGLKAELVALQQASAPTGEPGLDAVLLEVDTRVAVELAKLDRIGTELSGNVFA